MFISRKKYTAEEKYRAVAASRKSGTRALAQQYGIARTTLREWIASKLTDRDRLKAKIKLLEAQNKRLEMENDLLKIGEDRKKVVLSRVRLTVKYVAVKELHAEKRYTIFDLCQLCELNRSFYYKQITAENILNRNFTAQACNEKWLTDVTGFKYGSSGQKAYLSAILDVKDRRILHCCHDVRSAAEVLAVDVVSHQFTCCVFHKKYFLSDVYSIFRVAPDRKYFIHFYTKFFAVSRGRFSRSLTASIYSSGS